MVWAGLVVAQDAAQLPESPWPERLVISVALVVTIAILLLVVRRRLLRRRRTVPDQPTIEPIDVSSLDDAGPPVDGPQLEYYHVPVRLALVVIAPVGRDGVLPESSALPDLLDQLIPGLAAVFRVHRPELHQWPAQLSSEGFSQAFFRIARLPGNRGKGTPWCEVAGRCEADDQSYLVGIVCRAADRNSLGQIVIDRPGKWLDILRVRRA